MRQQIGDDIVDHAGRHHQPDRARRCQLLDEIRQRRGADGLLFRQLRYRVCGSVVDDALMAALQESFTTAGVTSLVNGFQSTAGLLITTCGIVCVTMRSITCWIMRCFAGPLCASE